MAENFGEIIRRNSSVDDGNGPVLRIEIDDDVHAGIEIVQSGSAVALSVTGSIDSDIDGGAVTADTLAVDTDTLVVNADSEIGFFGATEVGQQNIPETSPDLADVIAVLVNLGLAEQSDA